MTVPPRTVVAGNWKMHLGPEATRRFFRDFEPRVEGRGPTVLFFPPALSVPAAVDSRERDAAHRIGVQNIHWEREGAFTGEVSAPMAVEAGATHALVGHSERRHVFGETDEEVAKKVAAALEAGLVPVVCLGERLEERRAGRVDDVIVGQLDAALGPLAEAEAPGNEPPFLLAYEPVWAIGTGETATPGDASEAHGTLRRRLREALGAAAADAVPILYGGSVKPHNAAELLAAEAVDGVLVGGASLDPDDFARIVEAGA